MNVSFFACEALVNTEKQVVMKVQSCVESIHETVATKLLPTPQKKSDHISVVVPQST